MAEDLAAAHADRPEDRVVHRGRFAVAYLALAVVAGVAVGGAFLLAGDTDRAPVARWSTWQPEGREGSFPTQIAKHVSARYRLPSGSQMAAAIAGPVQVQGVPVEAVAIQGDTGAPSDISVAPIGRGIMYELCGLGQSCSIREGEPSEARFQLLRQQALELALYSFRFMDGLETALVLLPPNLGDPENAEDDTSVALFFRRDDLAGSLERPLAETLRGPLTEATAEVDPSEALVVERLTDARVFQYDFQPSQAGRALLYLVPLAAAG